jgi:putative transposase
MKLLESTLASTPIARPIPTDQVPRGLCLDRGYDFDEVRELAVAHGFEPHIRTRGEELAEKIRDPSWRARRLSKPPTHG